jgi:hypothetical protein
MNRLSKAFFALLAICLTLSSMQKSQAATLAEYGDIIVSDKAPAPVLLAAKDLQYHLGKITGREFRLVNKKANAAAGTQHFYVGRGHWPELDARAALLGPAGYQLVTVPEGLLLSGGEGSSYNGGVPQSSGVSHAVSLFLREQCGVDWLWPGKSGEVIPHNPNLTVPQLDRSGKPVLQRHHVKYYTAYSWAPGQREERDTWQRRTLQGDELAAGFGHSWNTVLPRDVYFTEHPEWFAVVNGKREPKQLCPSNMEMRDEFVKRLITVTQYKRFQILPVSPNDGYGFCECPLCQAKDDEKLSYFDFMNNPHMRLTDKDDTKALYGGYQNAAYWDFVNDIAKRVKVLRPDLGIGSLAYTNGRKPPEHIERLPDNVMINTSSYATQFMLPGVEKEYTDYLDSWKAKGVKLAFYEYWGMHYWQDLPVLYPREIAWEIKIAYAAGNRVMYGEGHKNFSTQALNYYVAAHQMWDPQGTDPEKTMAKFYSAFGPAAAEVRQYHEALGDSVRRTWREKKLPIRFARVIVTLDDMFDAETLTRAKAALDAADAKARADAALKQRLAFLRIGYNYTELMAELLGLYEKIGLTGTPFGEVDANFKYTKQEKEAWMRRAWNLGQKRIEMLNANRGNFALDEGSYARHFEQQVQNQHEKIGKVLGKADTEVISLIYTKRSSKPQD